jgi:hypothetical protein
VDDQRGFDLGFNVKLFRGMAYVISILSFLLVFPGCDGNGLQSKLEGRWEKVSGQTDAPNGPMPANKAGEVILAYASTGILTATYDGIDHRYDFWVIKEKYVKQKERTEEGDTTARMFRYDLSDHDNRLTIIDQSNGLTSVYKRLERKPTGAGIVR